VKFSRQEIPVTAGQWLADTVLVGRYGLLLVVALLLAISSEAK